MGPYNLICTGRTGHQHSGFVRAGLPGPPLLGRLPLSAGCVLRQGAGDQIYGAMNKAMRLSDAPALAFWRPLLWHIDRALLALPPYRGRLYRGISLRFSELTYRSGQEVCWPAFSSASTDKSVGESFVSNDEGTLFILQSTSARSISHFSKFPEEAEVLFRPNTTFQISSTLFGNTDIGQFYSSVDNIAMRVSCCAFEAGPSWPQPQPLLQCQTAPEAKQIVVYVE